MKSRHTYSKLLFLSSFFTFIVAHAVQAGGPWTPWKHKGIFIASVSPNIYSTISGDTSGINLFRRVSDISAQFYLEYGITNELAMVVNLPLRYVQTSKSLVTKSDGSFPDAIPSGKMFSLGNPSLELKYKNYQSDKIATAFGFLVEAPSSFYNNETGLRTGYNAWAFVPQFHFGAGFSERLYLQLLGAFAWRTNDYSDEWRANIELGYKLKRPFWIALLLQARQSLNNGSRDDADILASNNLKTGLYLNNEQYYAWSFKFAYAINPRLGINWALGGGIVTRYVARTPAFTFGVYYDWQEEKPEKKQKAQSIEQAFRF